MKLLALMLLFYTTSAFSQNTFTAQIIDSSTREPLPGATLQIQQNLGAVADQNGRATIPNIKEDTVDVTVSFVGYQPYRNTFILPQNSIQIIELVPGEELEEVIVTTTRSSRTIDNIPTRIEVISSEELAEKAIMRSSNIAMVLRESTGIQMQMTSASSANQSIRIQGLDGRYTQILKDGFPLYGGFAGGLSIMQIPPLDLKQIEVIKGSNSTLFGGGAIAGLVNLVTHLPEEKQKLRLMLDQTQALGSTINGFYAKKSNKLGITFYTSASSQQPYDSNDDDFSDIPKFRSLTINPSLFYYFNNRSNIRLSLNSTLENRLGGDMQVIENKRNGIHQFTEENETNRFSYQLTYSYKWSDQKSLTIKNSLTSFDRKITEPDFVFKGNQKSTFSETALSLGNERSAWITGLNLYTDQFNEDPATIAQTSARDYNYITLGTFTQNTLKISDKYSLESGFRFDYDRDFGFFALPRISFLAHINSKLTARIGGGLGYKLPTIFNEDAENLTYQNILSIDTDQINAEKSIGGNLDFNFNTPFGDGWSLSVNQLFFYTRLNDALVFRQNSMDQFFYENADGPVQSTGMETNLKLGYQDFKLIANYALINTRLRYDNLNQQKPLTPKHNIGAVLIYEKEDSWRIGYEAYYTGNQLKSNGSRTADFWIMGLMVMKKLNRLSLYINFENFSDTRQHRLENFQVDSHFKPDFPEIWAPTDGRIINAGLIFEL